MATRDQIEAEIKFLASLKNDARFTGADMQMMISWVCNGLQWTIAEGPSVSAMLASEYGPLPPLPPTKKRSAGKRK